jgi:hypothetical protein
MMELTGVRNNPEGFEDDDVQLLKQLAQGLGSNGVKAVIMLAERVLNPSVPQQNPAPRYVETVPAPIEPSPTPAPVAEDDEPSSAMSFTPLAPTPQAAPTVPTRNRKPQVRRARAPGQAPTVQTAAAPAPEAAEAPAPRRGRKRGDDPLAAGKAAVAQQAAPTAPAAPGAAQPPSAAPPTHQPVPMPRGLGMTMAMEQKAGESLAHARVIEASGGGVL